MPDQQIPLSGDDAGDAAPPMPRWVRMLGVIAIILVLTFVISHLAEGGFSHHMQSQELS
ncbi:MAG: hypothetical protein ABI718_09455 [Acidobacteriota bacterium]